MYLNKTPTWCLNMSDKETFKKKRKKKRVYQKLYAGCYLILSEFWVLFDLPKMIRNKWLSFIEQHWDPQHTMLSEMYCNHNRLCRDWLWDFFHPHCYQYTERLLTAASHLQWGRGKYRAALFSRFKRGGDFCNTSSGLGTDTKEQGSAKKKKKEDNFVCSFFSHNGCTITDLIFTIMTCI